uniref:Uncharacterized protein n=1 Tax=Pararge aegeria TaxID=116150 RepID=S4PT16_9NEOP
MTTVTKQILRNRNTCIITLRNIIALCCIRPQYCCRGLYILSNAYKLVGLWATSVPFHLSFSFSLCGKHDLY